jgi:carboxyl-terminal processing protease
MSRLQWRLARGAAALAVALTPWLAAPAPTSWAAPAAQLAPARPAAGLRAVEKGLNDLLDRYPQPLDPARLLQAAWQAALEAAGPRSQPVDLPAAFPAERDAAWDAFREGFSQLVGAGADPDALGRAANRAMAASVDDCHTRFAPSYEQEIAAYDGGEKYGGIGASALDASRFEPAPPGPVVVDVVAGGPAAVAGLRPGDAIVGVDDVDTAGWPNAQVVRLVRGAAGTTVRLRVERPGEPEPVEVSVERAEIRTEPLAARYIAPGAEGGPGVGYIQLRSFSRPVEPALPQVVESLYEEGARAWVLDLRNNGGGALPTFTSVASLFIKDGTLGVTTDRDGAESLISASGAGHKPYTQPLAVLVNSLSASASELLAADLQEYGAARIFGETTAGCFGTSQLFRLPDGSAMWITVRALQSGLARRDVHRLGVVPDESVQRTRADLAGGSDPQLAAALAWLQASARPAAAQVSTTTAR